APPAALPWLIAALGHGGRTLLGPDLVAAVAAHAFGVRRDRRERHAQIGGGERLAAAVDHPDDDRFLRHVDALRHRAARRAALAALARRDVEGVADLRELALHLLIRLELVDQTALETPAPAGALPLGHA